MKNTKLVRYRVFDKDGKYHQSYLLSSDAKACAKHIGGVVKEVKEEEK
jgi:hypothetical protein